MALLRAEDLCKSFGGLEILSNIQFSAEAGEKIALIGPNGAGKSTFFNVLGGQLAASKGRIFLGERDVTNLSPDRRLHLGLARSYQINNLFFSLPLLSNMMLALYGGERSHFQMLRSLYGRRDYREAAQESLELMDLWDKRLEPLTSLSYGDQRLVEIALAMASKPKLVLLDEPTAGLPTAEALNFGAKIRQLAGEATVIFCAHDMDLVFNLADRISVLCSGQIIAEGDPSAIRSNPKVQEIYLGCEDPFSDA
jgi:branched-chain amino acid transport system ATP-binding protein